MLTPEMITAGADRLDTGKLVAVDVDQASSILSMDTFFGGLVDKYGYDFKGKLAEFDDTGNEDQIAAQIAACLNMLETLGFGVSSLSGGKDGLGYKEKEEYWQYVQIIFLKMYKLPFEMSRFSLARTVTAKSGTAFSRRVERWR
jgi:hypothetical protein